MNTLQKQSLFWDIDRHTLDLKEHRRFIVERILAKGDIDDVSFARGEYGDLFLKEVLCSSKSIDAKSLSFWCSYFNIDIQQCIEKPSLLKRAAFWRR